VIDIIIDIETLGTKPNVPVIEIGACAINNRTGEIVSNFSRRVRSGYVFADLLNRKAVEHCTPDMQATIKWWLEDSDRADTLRKIMPETSQGVHPHATLLEFCDWFIAETVKANGEVRVWANGPQFDLVILQSHFDRYSIKRPWVCWQERCVRTALEMANYERGSIGWIERGPRHRALNDARHEARKLYYSGALGEVSAIIKRLHQRGGNFKVEVR